jgi:signal recognition particle subunit SRP54
MFSYLSNKLEKVVDYLKGVEHITDESMQKVVSSIENALLESDVPNSAIESFIEDLKKRCIGTKISKKLKADEFVSKQLYDVLVDSLGGINQSNKDFIYLKYEEHKKINTSPFTIALAGLQGVGKTTAIGKLIHHLKNKDCLRISENDIAVISLDYIRPAAREQLKILASQNNVDFFEFENSNNILEYTDLAFIKAKELNKKILIFDTAGRTSVDTNMTNELNQIWKKVSPNSGFLVIDSMSGQKGLDIAKTFSKEISFNGIIATKMDSDSPGGVMLGLSRDLKLPILYASTGEKPDEFEIFNPIRVARRILGIGDFLSLAEIAREKIVQSEEEIIKSAFKSGDLTINQYIKVLKMIEKMGPLKKVLSMMPRQMMNQQISDEQLDFLETSSKNFRYMCDSMNKKEKRSPDLVYMNSSRRRRIALGSGLSEHNIELLLKQYRVMKEQMKGLSKFSSFFV